MPDTLTIPQTRDGAQALHDRLVAMGNVAVGLEENEYVSEALSAVDVVLARLDEEDMASRTGEMKAVAAHQVQDALTALEALRSHLVAIAGRVETLSDVADVLDGVISGAKSVFSL